MTHWSARMICRAMYPREAHRIEILLQRLREYAVQQAAAVEMSPHIIAGLYDPQHVVRRHEFDY